MQLLLAGLCLLLATTHVSCAPRFFVDRESEATNSAPFCRGTACPDFEVVKRTSNYQLRSYGPTTWALVKASGGYYKASGEGLVELLRYTAGANEDKKKLESTKPLVVSFTANEDFSKAEQNHTVAYYLAGLDQDSAPRPTDDNVKIVSFEEVQSYVKTFSGYATESSILKTAKALKEELKAEDIEVKTTFDFALYDGPQRVAGRHNEVFLYSDDSR